MRCKRLMRNALALASVLLFAGCSNTNTTMVGSGQPVLITKPVVLPPGSWASYAGTVNGVRQWDVSTSSGTLPAGYLALPLPASASTSQPASQ